MFERRTAAKALLLPLFFLAAGCQTLDTRPSDPQIADSATDESPIPLIKAAGPKQASLDENVPVTDVWERIRLGYSMGEHNNPRIEKELRRYTGKNGFFNRVAGRADPYLFLIVEELEAAGIPREIALLPIVESAFKPFAYSHGRASGLWQFISATGMRYGMKQTWWYDGRRDVVAATQGATKYLNTLKDHFDGDWLLALAAYNAGEYNVMRAQKKNRKRGKPTDYWSLDLPKETMSYVPRLLAMSRIVADPARYGIKLKPIENRQKLVTVNTGGQIDLAIAADMIGISLDDLYRLNPGFNRWATDPAGPHRLLVPLEKAGQFEQALSEMPKSKRVQWARHKVRNGEALSLIAKRYRTTTSAIRTINKMKSDRIRAGSFLLVPVSVKNANAYALTSVQRERARRVVPKAGAKTVYTVRNGDSLWSIARKYKVSHKLLARWNGLQVADPLSIGSKLTIWHTDVAKKPSGPVKTSSANPYIQKVTYRVRNGDSLDRIARKFRVSVADLKNWNPKRTGKYIHPGQTIKVHVDVTRTSGSI